MARTTIHLMRHGEVHNPEGILYGRLPGYHLSELGRQMALQVADVLSASGHDIAAVVTSPLERARETGAPTAAAFDLAPTTDARLIEAGNHFEGVSVNRNRWVLAHPEHWRYYLNPLRPSWGEPYTELVARMSAAVRAGKIGATPCCVPGGQKHRPVRESARQVATPEEVRAAADAMPGHLRVAVLLAAWCQTRMGEAIGLQRQDLRLNEDPPVLRVERQIQHITGQGPVETPPKSAAGVREVVIPASLVRVLHAHLDAHVDAEPEAWILHPEDSRRIPVHPNTLRRAWERAREKAGIPWFKFHDLRHTGLTIFAQQGATLAELLHRGGHSDVDVALRYQHATRERDEALTARMDAHVRV